MVPLPGIGQFVCSKVYDVGGVHDLLRRRQLLTDGGVVAGESVAGVDLDSLPKCWSRSCSQRRSAFSDGPGTMSNSRAGPVSPTFFDQVDDYSDELGISLFTAVFSLVFIHAQHPYCYQVVPVAVDQITGLVECDLVDRVPPDVQGLRDSGHTHPVEGQTLEHPAGALQGHHLFRWSVSELLLEDPRRTMIGANQPG